jgi:glycerophosphoryl diester phosphodiesterase
VSHPYFALPGPWLIAHRGGAALAPENTVVAFENAEALGADAIETDVRLSRDGHVMVFHDEETRRICGVAGSIVGRTRAEIETLEAGFSFTDRYGLFPWRGVGVGVPALADVLSRFPRMRFNIDAKSSDPALAEALARTLRDAASADRVCVGSAHAEQSERLRGLLPEWASFLPTSAALRHVASALHLIPSRWCPEGYQLAALSRLAGQLPGLLPALLRHFGARGMPIQIWTVDDEREMGRLLKAGVHGVMTDRPDLLKSVMGR